MIIGLQDHGISIGKGEEIAKGVSLERNKRYCFPIFKENESFHPAILKLHNKL